MFIAMNRFKIVPGKEEQFEKVWREGDTHVSGVPGFKEFHLVKGKKNDEFSLYASHSIWNLKVIDEQRICINQMKKEYISKGDKSAQQKAVNFCNGGG